MDMPVLKTQAIPYEDPDSRYMFQPGPTKPFLATERAIDLYRDQIHRCLAQLQSLAADRHGLDYRQVFDDPDKPEALWFIEDDGGAITALLPSDY